MAVVSLVQHSSKDTIAVLKGLLLRAMQGELRGIALCYRTADAEELSVFTGNYKHHPEDGLAATMALSWRLTEARDRKHGAP